MCLWSGAVRYVTLGHLHPLPAPLLHPGTPGAVAGTRALLGSVLATRRSTDLAQIRARSQRAALPGAPFLRGTPQRDDLQGCF